MSPDMEETEADRQFEPRLGCCEDCDEALSRRRIRRRDDYPAVVAPPDSRTVARRVVTPALRERMRARFVRVARWRYRRGDR